jgi:hypothetical protein
VKKRFMVTAVAAVAMVAAFATTAQAFPDKTSACSGCHTKSTVVNVAPVQTANDGVKATYSITVTGPNSVLGWTVLNGSTMVANATAGTGTFQVPVGKTYTVWGVSKNGSMPYSNSITISPVAPGVQPTPVPTATPEPTSAPVPKWTITKRMRFAHRIGMIVRLKNLSTGKRITGKISRSRTKVTFKRVAAGTYVLTTKYKSRKTKTIGKYTVVAGKMTRWVAATK